MQRKKSIVECLAGSVALQVEDVNTLSRVHKSFKFCSREGKQLFARSLPAITLQTREGGDRQTRNHLSTIHTHQIPCTTVCHHKVQVKPLLLHVAHPGPSQNAPNPTPKAATIPAHLPALRPDHDLPHRKNQKSIEEQSNRTEASNEVFTYYFTSKQTGNVLKACMFS